MWANTNAKDSPEVENEMAKCGKDRTRVSLWPDLDKPFFRQDLGRKDWLGVGEGGAVLKVGQEKT